MPISLGELAAAVGCELIGDPDTTVSCVASLTSATPDALSFLSSAAYSSQLSSTKAAAVVLKAHDASACPVAAFVSDNPYATYARMAALICPEPLLKPGVHPSASIADTANVAASAHIAAFVVIGDRSIIGENTVVGPGTVIGPDCVVGDDCRFVANVSVVKDVSIGARSVFHPGVVIGADGFGNAMTPEGWVKIPQLGGVRIGNDVEIGSNTTIDCGAIGDTIVEDGVRIDNLCMIGHNAHVGEHTAMVASTLIAGSTKIGKRCMFAGSTGTVGHITICDDVVVSAKSFLSKDVTEPGTYSAGFPAVDSRSWAKQLARFRRLGKLIERLKKLEK